MPVPIVPSEVKAMIPQTSGSFCERFKKLFNFPRAFHAFLSYAVREDGGLTDEFQTDLCALSCSIGGGGTEPPNPSMPAPQNLVATDGSFSDHVAVSWSSVTPPSGISAVSQYQLYRSLSSNSNPADADLIATITAPTLTYDDEGVVQGSTYRYWVRASNGTQTSSYSSPDLGSASAPTTTLDAITDLKASIGYGIEVPFISLAWTPIEGSEKFDIYRGTTSDFEDAALIYADVIPKATTFITPNDPECWENIGTVVLYHTPPSESTDYHFWVIGKKDSPPATSEESNSAIGRVNAPAIYNVFTEVLDYNTDTYIVPAGITKMYAIVVGGGGGGAGGGGPGTVYGGGGGGAGATVIEAFTVAEADEITLVTTGSTPDTGNAPAGSSGDDGAQIKLQINAVDVIVAEEGGGGISAAGGGGSGGAASTGSTGTTSPTIYEGAAGEDASGSSGGRSGHRMFTRRLPQADGLGGYAGDGDSRGGTGSGAKAISINGALAVGGHGCPGFAYLWFGS